MPGPVSATTNSFLPFDERVVIFTVRRGLPSRTLSAFPTRFRTTTLSSSLEQWTVESSTSHSISALRGKPFVLTFHLGYACTHCAGQLRTFAQKSKQFQAAGLSIHTISTDDADGIKRSIENAPNGLPFQLLSNAAMDVFKAYRCFDDFENKPLHGTFLIDAEGLVRWQDIGPEPFADLDFLLVESNRLLKQGTSENLSAAASAR